MWNMLKDLSSKKLFIIILIIAILTPTFIGLAYFSKRYGEGETSAKASGYILDNEVDIKEKEDKGYYYTLNKDIVDKYKQALNTAYAWNSTKVKDITWPNTTLYNGLNGSYFLTQNTIIFLKRQIKSKK